MAKRAKINAEDYYVEDDYYQDHNDGYYDEYDEEEAERAAIQAVKKEKKRLEKERKKAKGVQDADIDFVESQVPNLFTREQIKGVLESYKNDKTQAIENLRFK